MNINELHAFVTVAEISSFSAAAEQLHLTQPAVSKRVSTLERDLNTQLFDRISRKINLTEAGKALLPRARKMLLEMEDIRRSISNLTGTISGTLTMGTSHHVGLRRLPPALKRYSQEYPEVKLDIRFMDSELACTAVEHGDLELAIVTLPIQPRQNLATTKIWHDSLLFVAADNHPLTKKRRLQLSDLAGYPAVLAAKRTYTREIMEQALKPMGLSLEIGMATNYLETLKMMVKIGLGWGLLPATMIENNDLQILKVPSLDLSRSLGAVTHNNRTLSNAARAMIEICMK
ncbi:LysR family transcriptional regulator [Candidatus Vondammii sp. HM_W22]|uniref:LysR family transcriptional regulator n=1 Tax=Candidatus Vondammii sp. HM_W22 TaxID=2687299 RepID=UPI001F14949F|nr:LysR family transcriptional regulator [Candidatus Vondammii sp. HM_W22]